MYTQEYFPNMATPQIKGLIYQSVILVALGRNETKNHIGKMMTGTWSTACSDACVLDMNYFRPVTSPVTPA